MVLGRCPGKSRVRGDDADCPLCSKTLCSDGEVAELPEASEPPGTPIFHNLQLSRKVIGDLFAELEEQCREEKQHYELMGQRPPQHCSRRWAVYLNAERVRGCKALLQEFVRGHPECRARGMSRLQLRFLLLLQHRVSEDTWDLSRPSSERRHCDSFQGVLTADGVNSQLVKDAHRSDWSVDGCGYSLQHWDGVGTRRDRRQQIYDFQRSLMTALESCVLGFSSRRSYPELAARKLLQAVTTQMSQCGLANLDGSSQAGGYFVGGLGLEQRTAYTLSTVEDEGYLQLSLCCLKTGFTHFHTEVLSVPADPQEWDEGPCSCAPASYLYQYATLRFSLRKLGDPKEHVECLVIDALDEVHIQPATVDGWLPL